MDTDLAGLLLTEADRYLYVTLADGSATVIYGDGRVELYASDDDVPTVKVNLFANIKEKEDA